MQRQRVVRYRSPPSFRAPSFGRKEPHTTRAASAPCRFATLRTQNGDCVVCGSRVANFRRAFEFRFAARIDAARRVLIKCGLKKWRRLGATVYFSGVITPFWELMPTMRHTMAAFLRTKRHCCSPCFPPHADFAARRKKKSA